MDFINRFSIIERGAMTFTGNTLGLSKERDSLNAGTLGSIGAFTTTDTSMQVPTYPPGTTQDYLLNSSSNDLVLPAGSTVLYAELIWGGYYTPGSPDLNLPVSFTDPSSITHNVVPDSNTSNEFPFGSNVFYMRSSNVTAIVQAAGGGSYTTGAVPGLLEQPSSLNHAGWTLAVIYENPALPKRSMNLFVGAEGIVSSGGPQVIDVMISGFLTPPMGPIDARLMVSSQEGDADITRDQALFGPDDMSLTNLSGPNNPSSNFFASQINDDTGNIDTTGTFGTRNHDAFSGTNIVAGRQGWDITNVSGSGLLPNNQGSAVFRYTTTGDAYMPNALGIQIDSVDVPPVPPPFEVVKSTDLKFAEKGDILTYTVEITNNGTEPSGELIFTDYIPKGTTFVEDSLIIGGVPYPGVNPHYGVSLPEIPPGETLVITFQVLVRTCDALVRNQAHIELSDRRIEPSNLVTTTICEICNGN
ncbi:DUF11 domain-containing protein [Halobacillus yeomjeoni]|uniref:DUF11 domain-containing protein n=1 Tax=Halobacillus yeomjeoni TaxID=311194 RepID=UPI001CD2493E|nr:DUF11 domain-containing protein [Halobacillus yeomjeoni]MCA0983439.1 DUF11 domain-containing protein [Halobacillus yeomjeoni]